MRAAQNSAYNRLLPPYSLEPSYFALFLFLAACVAVPALMFYALPYEYGRLISEDDFGESTTFAAFSMATVSLFYLFIVSSRSDGRYWYLLMGIACAFLAGEEVSWGQRFFSIPTPDAIRELNVQGELNLHNIDDGALWSVYTVTFTALALYGGLSAAGPKTGRILHSVLNRVALPVPAAFLLPLFVAPFVYWIFTTFARKDELVELYFSVALLAFSADRLHWFWRQRKNTTTTARLRTSVIVVVLAAATAGGFVLPYLSTPPKSLQHTLLLNATTLLPRSGHIKQAETLFNTLETHSESQDVPQLLIAKAHFLDELGRTAEAAESYRQVVQLQTKYLNDDSNDLSALEILIVANMGINEREEATRLLSILEERIEQHIRRIGAQQGGSSSRSMLTQRYWDREKSNDDRKSKLLIRLGDAYASIGQPERAIDEYLRASHYSTWGNTHRFLAERYLAISKEFDCKVSQEDRVTEAEVDLMIEQHVNVCADAQQPATSI